MTKLLVQPFTMKDVLFKVDVDDYARHVSEVTFTPNVKQDDITWQGLSPDASFSDSSTPEVTWTVTVAYAQDWETTDSMSRYLLDHVGEVKPVVFEPKAGVGTSFASDVTIVPGPVGGKVKTVAEGSVNMRCTEPIPSPIV
jgi:hypothetical protein